VVKKKNGNGLVRIYVLDSCIFLNELSLVKKLSRYFGKEKWAGKIVVPYAVIQELRGLARGAKKKSAQKVFTFVEKNQQNQVWSFDRSKGEGIVPRLLAQEQLSSSRNPKRTSLNDLRILATAMYLQDCHRRREDGTRETRIYLVTADRALKDAAYKYGVTFLGTLKKLWRFNRRIYLVNRDLKRKLYKIRKKYFRNKKN